MEDALAIQRAHLLCDVHRPAEAAALIAPVLAAEHLRAQGIPVRPMLGNATLILMATASGLLTLLAAAVLISTGTPAALVGTVVFGALTFAPVRVAVRRRRRAIG